MDQYIDQLSSLNLNGDTKNNSQYNMNTGYGRIGMKTLTLPPPSHQHHSSQSKIYTSSSNGNTLLQSHKITHSMPSAPYKHPASIDFLENNHQPQVNSVISASKSMSPSPQLATGQVDYRNQEDTPLYENLAKYNNSSPLPPYNETMYSRMSSTRSNNSMNSISSRNVYPYERSRADCNFKSTGSVNPISYGNNYNYENCKTDNLGGNNCSIGPSRMLDNSRQNVPIIQNNNYPYESYNCRAQPQAPSIANIYYTSHVNHTDINKHEGPPVYENVDLRCYNSDKSYKHEPAQPGPQVPVPSDLKKISPQNSICYKADTMKVVSQSKPNSQVQEHYGMPATSVKSNSCVSPQNNYKNQISGGMYTTRKDHPQSYVDVTTNHTKQTDNTGVNKTGHHHSQDQYYGSTPSITKFHSSIPSQYYNNYDHKLQPSKETISPRHMNVSSTIRAENAKSLTDETSSAPKLLAYNVTPAKPMGPTEAERKIEELTKELEEEMEKKEAEGVFFGICHTCGEKVTGAEYCCQAMGNVYHTNCFICCSCGRALRGKTFYYFNAKIYCEEDYLYSGFQQTAEKCAICGHLIMEMILHAMGNSYHPGCFRCCICNESLDEVPFTVDVTNKIYCVNDYNKMFAPKCAACSKAITPDENTGETIRVVAMDKDFHVDCYICENCGVQLTDEPELRCYPLNGQLMCRLCHIQQLDSHSSLSSLENLQSVSATTSLSSATNTYQNISN